MAYSELAKNAYHHLTKLGPKKLSEFIESIGPIDIPVRYGDDLLLGLMPHCCWSTIIEPGGTINLGSTCDPVSAAFEINRCAQKFRNAKYRIVRFEKRTLSDLTHRGDHWIQTIATQSEAERREVLLEIWGLGPLVGCDVGIICFA